MEEIPACVLSVSDVITRGLIRIYPQPLEFQLIAFGTARKLAHYT